MKLRFKYVTVVAACMILTGLVLTSTAWAQEDDGDAAGKGKKIGLTFSIDYTSNYLWRGTKYYGGDGAIFPSVTYTIPKVGITLYFGAELSQSWMFNGFKKIDDSEKYYLTGDIYNGATWSKKEGKFNHLAYSGHSLDFGGSWSYTIKEKFTIGAMAYFYYLYNTRDSFEYGKLRYSNGLLSLWTPVNWDILSTALWFGFDFVPWINPKIYVYHDYYTGRNVSGNYYVNLDLSHPFQLTDNFSLTIGISGAYYYRRITEDTSYYLDSSGNIYRSRTPIKKGISNVNPRVGISFTKGGLSLRAGFKWVIIPAKSFYKGSENHRYAANLGISYSL